MIGSNHPTSAYRSLPSPYQNAHSPKDNGSHPHDKHGHDYSSFYKVHAATHLKKIQTDKIYGNFSPLHSG